MTEPLVTCITPTFGRIHLLCEMYWSWNRQDYKNKELLILNDQPNVELYSDEKNVRIINLSERMVGLGAKRNILFNNISPETKYVMPFDDDDLFLPKHISSLVQGLEDNPEHHRSKNIAHLIANDNTFQNITYADWPFFGASCFNSEKVKNFKFKETYNKGEDAAWLNDNNMTASIVRTPPTFIYRLGMNIVHTSGVGSLKSNNTEHQKIIYDKIGNSVKIFDELKKMKLRENISKEAKALYNITLKL